MAHLKFGAKIRAQQNKAKRDTVVDYTEDNIKRVSESMCRDSQV